MNAADFKQDFVITSLKKRWLDLAGKEDMPHTPQISKELDNLEEAIDQLEAERKGDL